MAFTYKGTFTVTSNSSLLPSTQTDFTVLVSVTDNSLKSTGNGGAVTDPTADDVNFFSDTNLTSLLSWEIEKWDAATGELLAWVLIPSLALGTVFYAGIGDSGVTTFQGGAEGAAWDNNFVTVTHGGDGTTLSLLDSSGNNWDGTNNGLTATTGKIYGGLDSDGTQNAFVSSSNGLVTGQAITFSGWFRVTASTGGSVLGSSDATAHDWMIYAGSGSPGNWFVFVNTTSDANVATGTAWSDTWTHIVGTYDGSNIRAYLNGVETGGPTAQTGNLRASGTARFGWYDYLLTDAPTQGKFDESRVSNVVRSANWIKAEYNSQNDPSTFVSNSIALFSSLGRIIGISRPA